MRLARVATVIAVSAALVTAKKQPNIVFILTDDQDVEMQSVRHMPLLQKHIINQGTWFDRHYCTVSICCPSRVNLWTGQAAHNTNVTDVATPYGGYPKFVQQGLNEQWLPVWLQQLGYNTYYSGKLFNYHNVQNYDDPFVKGFNGSDFLLDPYTYEYFNAKMTRNGGIPVGYAGLYSPDVVAQKAYGFLEEAVLHTDRPFFLGIAPIAPHSNMKIDFEKEEFIRDTPLYAERHAHLFKEYKIPRTANFNPDVPSGVGWVKDLPKLNDTVVEYHDEFQRSRLRALQSVDEMVEEVVLRLEAHGLLDSTYIFYTTDNGYHVGQHRLSPGKECPFEEDIHIPLAVRGPGVPPGHIANVVSSHTDLTPTLLKLAGEDRPDLDGTPIPLSEEDFLKPQSGEHVNVEFWGRAIPEGKYGKIGDDPWGNVGRVAARNNTYKALRVVSGHYSFLYTVYCTGEREFYDVHRDQYQMHNLLHKDSAHLAKDYTIAGRSLEHIIDRVDSLLMVTKSCKGHTCRRPWDVLHPDQEVRSLADALDSVFDTFYKEQPRVSFSSCPLGHIVSEEGPQDVNVWTTPQLPHIGDSQHPMQLPGHWSWWT